MQIDFSKLDGLVPAVVQDAGTKKVLMLGFMNEEAFKKTQAEKRVTFYSRSKKRLWTKGETSGNFLDVKDIKIDCDNDTLLILVEPLGPVCHTGSGTCFAEENQDKFAFLQTLHNIIADRRIHPKEGSYTTSLFQSGLNRVAQKVGEEAVELVIAVKDSDKDIIKDEAADLLFHFMVLLRERHIAFDDVIDVLKARHGAGINDK